METLNLLKQRISEGYKYAFYPYETGNFENLLRDKTYLTKSFQEAKENIMSERRMKSDDYFNNHSESYLLFDLEEELTTIWEAEEEQDRKAFERKLEEMEG